MMVAISFFISCSAKGLFFSIIRIISVNFQFIQTYYSNFWSKTSKNGGPQNEPQTHPSKQVVLFSCVMPLTITLPNNFITATGGPMDVSIQKRLPFLHCLIFWSETLTVYSSKCFETCSNRFPNENSTN